MIVLDASATLAWLFSEEDPLDWLSDVLQEDHFIAPSLWRLEVVNAVLRKERQQLISADLGDEFIQTLDELAIEVVEVCLARGLQQFAAFARSHQLSAYDAAYLQLALEHEATLLSLDHNLHDAARRLGVTMLAA